MEGLLPSLDYAKWMEDWGGLQSPSECRRGSQLSPASCSVLVRWEKVRLWLGPNWGLLPVNQMWVQSFRHWVPKEQMPWVCKEQIVKPGPGAHGFRKRAVWSGLRAQARGLNPVFFHPLSCIHFSGLGLLPSMHEALGSIPSTMKKKKESFSLPQRWLFIFVL
jgi:hypothetical protein